MTSNSDLEVRADRAAAAGDLAGALKLLEAAASAGTSTLPFWTKLSAIRSAHGDLAGALSAIERALALEPLDTSALLARAVLLDRSGDSRANQAFARAAAQLPRDGDVPPALASAADRARKRAAAYHSAVEGRLVEVIPAGLTDQQRKRLERFVSNTARRTRHFHQQPTDFHFPELPEIEFHDPSQFAGIAEIETATDTIRAEFEALVGIETAELVPYTQYPEHVPLAQWRELNNNRDWTAIHLLQNGRRVESNAKHCPQTLALLSKVAQPDIPGASPNAMFSLLAPRTTIPPHTGVANVRLVAHLPLIVPPGCGFRVGATTVRWKPGEVIVFDDTIEHEAWNRGDELRVVLIFDLWAPAIEKAEREAAAKVISSAGVSFTGS